MSNHSMFNRLFGILAISSTLSYSQFIDNDTYFEILDNYLSTVPDASDAAYGDDTWWSIYSSLFSGKIYQDLSCSGILSYDDYTNLTDPNLYRYVKTSNDSNKYNILEVTTCCGGQEYYFNEQVDTDDIFCSYNYSVDTVLYLLKYSVNTAGREAPELLATVDDDDVNICADTFKSTIDLSEYPAGEYFIGITGWFGWPGPYHIELNCVEFDYPPTADQLESHLEVGLNRVGDISCGDIIYNQANTRDTSISYYNFTIDENTATPTIISTCNPLTESGDVSSYETHLYLLRESGITTKIYTQIVSIENSYDCADNEYAAQFDISSLVETRQYGSYYIAVGGMYSQTNMYSLCVNNILFVKQQCK